MPTWFKMLLSILAVLVIGAIGHAMQEPTVKENLARKVLIEEPAKKQPRLVSNTDPETCDEPINWSKFSRCARSDANGNWRIQSPY